MHLPWHLYLMALIYIIAGLNHFRSPKLYIKIIPPYLPNASLINKVSGILEIVFGIMLFFKSIAPIGAVGIIVLLIGFFATHYYMLQNEKASLRLPKWILILRIPLQFVLIYWAYQYI
ncbi:DoxX family protein [Flavobacterium ponti]|uniref:DoxX family protein n=1 Tax=Flavobacterium ponti TaxID=665133 RepID=A0ABV9P5C2_9FLAO